MQCWALVPADRATFNAGLEARFHAMMKAGLLDEVRTLRNRGDLTPRHPAIRAVGYRQLWGHLDGEYDQAQAVRLGMAATRQLAKRQLTWLRSEPVDDTYRSAHTPAPSRTFVAKHRQRCISLGDNRNVRVNMPAIAEPALLARYGACWKRTHGSFSAR